MTDAMSGAMRGTSSAASSGAMRRSMHSRLRSVGFALLLCVTGCAVEDLRPDYDAARQLVVATTGADEVYDPDAPTLSAEQLQAVLAGGLTLDEALRLALLNNRRLQADFMGLGISRADYVQAGLLQNPSLGISFLFPSGGGRTRVAGELAQNVMEVWRIPSQRLAAGADMEQRVLNLSRSAGELVAATKATYFESVAARESRVVADENAAAARQALDAMRERVAAGVATEAEANLQHGLALGAELQARRAERIQTAGMRRLAALLSLDADLLGVPLADALPQPLPSSVDRENLVHRALLARLDVRAMAARLAAADARVALERDRALPDVTAGIAAERPEGGSTSDLLVGPALSIELPLFDRNEAQIGRAEFEREELLKLQEALLAEVGQEARAAADRLQLAARLVAFVQQELLPQAERSVALAQQAYELGDTTILVLLEARRAAHQARLDGIDALLESALAAAELERTLGGPPAEVPAPADPGAKLP